MLGFLLLIGFQLQHILFAFECAMFVGQGILFFVFLSYPNVMNSSYNIYLNNDTSNGRHSRHSVNS